MCLEGIQGAYPTGVFTDLNVQVKIIQSFIWTRHIVRDRADSFNTNIPVPKNFIDNI